MKRETRRGWVAAGAVCLFLGFTLVSTAAAGAPQGAGPLEASARAAIGPEAPSDVPQQLSTGHP
ncbi:MAG TPA: hypothetical protein VM537_28290, partial [Anaerolineae bacterium]|nr:hypothetical protein [Anaerolineae bacterium]